jgi:hypothetical protein
MTDKSEYRVLSKAYGNLDFLNSESARGIRILCEYEVRSIFHDALYIEAYRIITFWGK